MSGCISSYTILFLGKCTIQMRWWRIIGLGIDVAMQQKRANAKKLIIIAEESESNSRGLVSNHITIYLFCLKALFSKSISDHIINHIPTIL